MTLRLWYAIVDSLDSPPAVLDAVWSTMVTSVSVALSGDQRARPPARRRRLCAAPPPLLTPEVDDSFAEPCSLPA